MCFMTDGLVFEKEQGDLIVRCTHGRLQTEITEFVAKVYYKRADYDFDISFSKLVDKMLIEDDILKDCSTIFTIYNSNEEILGTIRGIWRTVDNFLPVENEFDADLIGLADKNYPVNEIVEVARFATSTLNPIVLKTLLKEGVASCEENDLLVASLDSRVLYHLKKLRFPWVDIGEPRQYLGSLTCPVAVNVRDIGGDFCYKKLRHENYVCV